MRLILILLTATLLSLLSGCGPIYQTTYSYIPPKGNTGKMCAMQCEQSKMMCQQMCEQRKETCQTNSRQQALFDYEEYKSEQITQGQPVTKTINDFYSDSLCADISCGCAENYNSCFSVCGGKVIPHTTCVAFCKNANIATQQSPVANSYQ